MPLYEYQCDQCKNITEMIQKFSDDPLLVCPDCGGNVQKLMSMSSFSLKGNGWYATDYKKPAAKAETSAAAVPATPATASGSAPAPVSTETKAASK